MDILILGNGFDLAHGLKTKYSDFLEWCNKKSLEDFSNENSIRNKYCKNNLWLIHFFNRQNQMGETWIDLETEIYNILKSLTRVAAIVNGGVVGQLCPQIFSITYYDNRFKFNNIRDYLHNPQEGYSYSELIGDKEYTDDVKSKRTNLYNVYIKTAKGFVNFLYDQLREFTALFEIYLQTEVLYKLNNQSPFKLFLNNNIPTSNKAVFVLSFNYTDTFEKLYKSQMNSEYKSDIHSFYVHGAINTQKECNLILGTQSFDNVITNNRQTFPINFNVFQKFHQRHKYGTIEEYQELLHILMQAKETDTPIFHIIGHSLDESDHIILKHILSVNPNSIINIYYHDEITQENLINNIKIILGEEEVMKKVRFIHQHDLNRGILIPQKETTLVGN